MVMGAVTQRQGTLCARLECHPWQRPFLVLGERQALDRTQTLLGTSRRFVSSWISGRVDTETYILCGFFGTRETFQGCGGASVRMRNVTLQRPEDQTPQHDYSVFTVYTTAPLYNMQICCFYKKKIFLPKEEGTLLYQLNSDPEYEIYIQLKTILKYP